MGLYLFEGKNETNIQTAGPLSAAGHSPQIFEQQPALRLAHGGLYLFGRDAQIPMVRSPYVLQLCRSASGSLVCGCMRFGWRSLS